MNLFFFLFYQIFLSKKEFHKNYYSIIELSWILNASLTLIKELMTIQAILYFSFLSLEVIIEA